MNTKLIILLLGTVAFAHICAARPEAKSSEEINEIKKDNELQDKVAKFMEKILKEKDLFNDHFKVFIAVTSEYAVHARESVQQGLKVCRLMMNEPFIEKLDTEDIHARAEDFAFYVTKAEASEKNEGDDPASDLFELSERISRFIDIYNITLMEKPTMEDVLFGLALEKNGIEEANKEIEKSFSKFLVKMIDIVDKYIANLSAENKEAETKLIEFMPKYKALDIKDQKKKIRDFFTLFKLKRAQDEDEGKKTTV
ncbi:uncharacterized protein LOC119688974 [Teleopsis dalmanni]|uniref:uncharacterized protein LOC119688974 n=1 Tax=Teleopsis dalmanni TaxID=139649 RepID=UPI0018CE1B27|nr:uncharacterized protein LOC119688974 [Teleopsis dalmanni]